MKTDIKHIIDEIIRAEGGYVHHMADLGGPTCYGITENVARANGYDGDMRDLPEELARRIYETRYYQGPGFDRVAEHSLTIATELTDTGVNMGPATAIKFLQRALNALNLGGQLFPDLNVDGQLGDKSIAALSAYLAHRGSQGELVLYNALNALQAERYIAIAENNHTQEAFVYGWLLNRATVGAR